MFVCRVVVADDMNLLILGHGIVDLTQELQPFLMAVSLLALAIHLAIGDVQRGEQGGCAVALVVGRHGCATAGL